MSADFPRPSPSQLLRLQAAVNGVREQLDRDGGEHAFGLTRADIAIISWSLGVATAFVLDQEGKEQKVLAS
jgi:hypothetical protein